MFNTCNHFILDAFRWMRLNIQLRWSYGTCCIDLIMSWWNEKLTENYRSMTEMSCWRLNRLSPRAAVYNSFSVQEVIGLNKRFPANMIEPLNITCSDRETKWSRRLAHEEETKNGQKNQTILAFIWWTEIWTDEDDLTEKVVQHILALEIYELLHVDSFADGDADAVKTLWLHCGRTDLTKMKQWRPRVFLLVLPDGPVGGGGVTVGESRLGLWCTASTL